MSSRGLSQLRAWAFDSQLSAFPLSGKPARDVDSAGARELVFESYRIFYDVSDRVESLTVWRASEQIDSSGSEPRPSQQAHRAERQKVDCRSEALGVC